MEPEKQEQIKRKPDGTYEKGISGNPNGRPKGKTLKEFARELLMSMEDEEKKAYLKKLPFEIVWRMAEGNPHQTQEHSGEVIVGQPILGGLSQKHVQNEGTDKEV